MSKEMTPKEALKEIKASHLQAHIDSKNIGDFNIWFDDLYSGLEQAINKLEELEGVLSHYFTLALKRDSKWSTGLSKEEEKELVNIEYKIIEMISENQL